MDSSGDYNYTRVYAWSGTSGGGGGYKINRERQSETKRVMDRQRDRHSDREEDRDEERQTDGERQTGTKRGRERD